MDILAKLKLRNISEMDITKALDLDYPNTIYSEAASEIESLRKQLEASKEEVKRLGRRIYNQRVQLRETWQIVEQRMFLNARANTYACIYRLHRNMIHELKLENKSLREKFEGSPDAYMWKDPDGELRLDTIKPTFASDCSELYRLKE